MPQQKPSLLPGTSFPALCNYNASKPKTVDGDNVKDDAKSQMHAWIKSRQKEEEETKQGEAEEEEEEDDDDDHHSNTVLIASLLLFPFFPPVLLLLSLHSSRSAFSL